MDVYFNSKKMPREKKEYVAFLDIMGTSANMAHSVNKTANYIFKLHAAILSAWKKTSYEGVFVYPVMDGAYITSRRKDSMEKVLVSIMDTLSKIFVEEIDDDKRFVIRAGLAYGELIHGHEIPFNASKIFELDLGYKNNLLLGSGMILANESEKHAAPFGIYVDSSAEKHIGAKQRSFGTFDSDWKWYLSREKKTKTDVSTLKSLLVGHFEEFKDENHPLHYDEEKINNHIQRINDYFLEET